MENNKNNIGNWNTGDCNTGHWNTGNCNTGNCNTGDWNTGDCNIGDYNTGKCNAGGWNVGHWNIGDNNTGNCNTGNCNAGNDNTGGWNAGDCNTGYCNICDSSSGVFCTAESTINLFDKPTNMTLSQFRETKVYYILRRRLRLSKWINEDSMTEEEKKLHPEYETVGGYLKKYEYKEMWENAWSEMSEEEKQEIMKLPNFDEEVFYEITGIKVEKPKNAATLLDRIIRKVKSII